MAERDTHPKLVVGLTGGIGSGKSSVSELFAELGATIIDTDQLARELVEPGTQGLDSVIAHFGNELLDKAGHLDRAKLRDIVFADPARRRQLENIMHPLIRTEVKQHIASADGAYCIVCIPLLLETGQEQTVDRVLVVDAPRETRIERVLQRDDSPRATIEGILAAQIGRQQRLDCADDVIDNSGNLDNLRPQVQALHNKYLKLARSR